MGIKERFEKKIREKEDEIQLHQEKIKEAENFIAAFQEAMRLLPREERGEDAKAKVSPRKGVLQVGSDSFKTVEFLRKTGHPLYIADILSGIGKEPTKENIVSLAGTLGVYVRMGKFFSRPKPNTFGLLEWDTQQKTDVPEGFGELDGSGNESNQHEDLADPF
jgi:hypothetical protein